MKSSAAGQLLGYSLQFPRALYHLLTCSPGDCVFIEVLGDVGVLKPDDNLVTEEDKSSVVGNPLTDKSTDLWKTFYNWIQAVNDGEIITSKTRFILYCNKSGQPGIVDEFSSALNECSSKAAIESAKDKIAGINEKHDIWKFYNYVVNENENILIDIIPRFELQIGVGASYDELREELKKKHIPETQLEFVLHKLSGWLQEYILNKIVAKENAVISWEIFDHQFKVLFDRSRKRELIDFTLQSLPKKEAIDAHIKERPTYIKQLDIIGLDDDEVVSAVSDYLRADINRGKWIETEIIDEDIARDFEEKLSRFWMNHRNRIEITESGLPEEDRGRLLYSDCMTRSETIRDISPPVCTIPGTYHALADEPILGWHPEWKKRLED